MAFGDENKLEFIIKELRLNGRSGFGELSSGNFMLFLFNVDYYSQIQFEIERYSCTINGLCLAPVKNKYIRLFSYRIALKSLPLKKHVFVSTEKRCK